MTLTAQEYAQLKADLLKEVTSQLLKPSRHENSDHIDGGLLPQKIAAVTGTGSSSPGGSVLTVSNNSPVWLNSVFPIGAPIPWPGILSKLPSGLIQLNGAAVSRSTYGQLFVVYGTTWGAGDGATTFNLPNIPAGGMFVQSGTASGGTVITLGSTGGEDKHALSVAEIPSHTHHTTTLWSSTFAALLMGSGGTPAYPSDTTASQTSDGGSGGGGSHNNMPPWAACNWVVRAL